MNPNWQEWIDILGRGDVSDEELRAFQKELEASPENKKAYLQALSTEVALELEDPLPHPKSDTPTQVISAAHSTSRVGQVIKISNWALPAAAVITAVLALSYFLTRQSPSNQTESSVATITDTNPAADAAGFKIGELLKLGKITLPDDAEVGIAMRGGARLKLKGPAILRLDHSDLVFLEKGRVKTYAPEYAHGFTINTEDGKVVDLGTRFVTAKGGGIGTEIHVLEGLVTAIASTSETPTALIKQYQATILKDGYMTSTAFLANRLNIPLNPTPVDTDGDNISDLIEKHYGTNPRDPLSFPEPLRVADSFTGYPVGDHLYHRKFTGKGEVAFWLGSGSCFPDSGLTYSNNGKSLLCSGGYFETIGLSGAGASINVTDENLPKDGSIYISFLMKLPIVSKDVVFSGLILYQGEYKEQLFLGKIGSARTFGSRFIEKEEEESFADAPFDDRTHLMVIHINHSQQITDVFLDPPLGEAPPSPNQRYQEAIPFDRISLRSGSGSGVYPVKFDEIRVGLTWDSVLPLAQNE
jgi:ferric-dicitrate binding protein FerR (iron transport regulator)